MESWVRIPLGVQQLIKNRVSVTVLRSKLLKQMDNGAYEPKRVTKEKVKEVLLSFRRDLIQGSESRCVH